MNGRVRHIGGGGVDLKLGEGGNPFQSNFVAKKDTSQNFQLLTQCLQNTQQLYSRTGTKYKIIFLI